MTKVLAKLCAERRGAKLIHHWNQAGRKDGRADVLFVPPPPCVVLYKLDLDCCFEVMCVRKIWLIWSKMPHNRKKCQGHFLMMLCDVYLFSSVGAGNFEQVIMTEQSCRLLFSFHIWSCLDPAPSCNISTRASPTREQNSGTSLRKASLLSSSLIGTWRHKPLPCKRAKHIERQSHLHQETN